MDAPVKHHLTIVDRGVTHRHRWTPMCSCTWIGVHRTSADDAAKEWRNAHMRAVQTAARRTRRRRKGRVPPRPRPVTPTDQLPELLR